MTRTERTYYLIQALYHASWSFTAPTYSLFLLSRGLDLLQINLVFATYLIAAFLFEVPTGAVADVFGRKISFLLSCLVRAGAFFYYSYASTFPEFLVAEFFDAIGTTLATGALDAWAVDGIRAEGDDRPNDKMFARAHVLARIPMMLAGLTAGYVATIDLAIPFVFGFFLFLATFTAGLALMRNDRHDRHPHEHRPTVIETLREGYREVRTDRALRWICGLTAAIAFAALPVWHTWPPRLQELGGGKVSDIGWIFVAINLCAIAANLVARRAAEQPRRRVVAAITLLRGLALLGAASSTTFSPALMGFLVFDMGFAVTEPILLSWTSERATAERRATVLSMRSMSFTLGGSAGLVVIGLIARDIDIPTAWLVGGFCITAVAPFCFQLPRQQAR